MVEIRWDYLKDDDSRWQSNRCLYAYIGPSEEILYIGKSWGTTVRSRWLAMDKQKLWIDLEKQRKISKHIPLVGEIYLLEGRRLTKQLLADIESLLINVEKPWGNIQAVKNRNYYRSGMSIKCSESWPGLKKYLDA